MVWTQNDSATALNLEEFLALFQKKNSESYHIYGDWTLPNTKKPQNIVDYMRSPDTKGSAVIDSLSKRIIHH